MLTANQRHRVYGGVFTGKRRETEMLDPQRPRYWYCLIGPVPDDQLPNGADFRPRMAAREEVERLSGNKTFVTASGWLEQNEYESMLAARSRPGATP